MEPTTHIAKAEEEPAPHAKGEREQQGRTLNASLDSAAQNTVTEAGPHASGELPGPGNPASDTGLEDAQAQAGEGVPKPTRSASTEKADDPGAKERMKRLEGRISG